MNKVQHTRYQDEPADDNMRVHTSCSLFHCRRRTFRMPPKKTNKTLRTHQILAPRLLEKQKAHLPVSVAEVELVPESNASNNGRTVVSENDTSAAERSGILLALVDPASRAVAKV